MGGCRNRRARRRRTKLADPSLLDRCRTGGSVLQLWPGASLQALRTSGGHRLGMNWMRRDSSLGVAIATACTARTGSGGAAGLDNAQRLCSEMKSVVSATSNSLPHTATAAV